MWTFLEVFIFGKKSVFSTETSSHAKLCFTCDSSLLIMSAKYAKWEVFSYFSKVKCEFIARSHTFYSNRGLLNTSSHLCQCKCVRVWKNTWQSTACFALFAWFTLAALLAGIVKTATNKACNECKCSDTNVVFQRAVFLILVVRNY